MKTEQTTAPVFILFLVKLGLKDQSVANQIVKGRRVLSMMKDNDRFPHPSPSLAEFTALSDQLEEAEAAMDRSRLKTEKRNAALKLFTGAFKNLQAYVEAVANGNQSIVLSSGFELRNHNTRSLILPAPVGVKAYRNGFSGQVGLKWSPVKGKKVYSIEMADSLVSGNWVPAGYSTKAKVTVTGLTPGQLYYFRVRVINPAGLSDWSEVASGRCE